MNRLWLKSEAAHSVAILILADALLAIEHRHRQMGKQAASTFGRMLGLTILLMLALIAMVSAAIALVIIGSMGLFF